MAEGGQRRDPSSHRTPAQIKRMDAGYNHTPEMRKRRSMNNQARRIYKKEHGAASVEGKDVDHIKMLDHGGGNYKKNLRAVSPSFNRAWRART
jgi:hypothetical protein